MKIKHIDTILPKSFIDYREQLKKEIHDRVITEFDTLLKMETIVISLQYENDDNSYNEFNWSLYSIQKIYEHQGYFTRIKEDDGTFILYFSLIPIHYNN